MGESFETIRYDIGDGVATIVLDRPEAMNAFTPQMNKEITKALKLAGRDDTVRCVVITGEGKAFSAGEDVTGIDENTNHAEFLRERYHPMVRELKHVPKPTIAAVNGVAAGAGMSLALAADFRVMNSEAKFVSAFMDLGLIPDSGLIYVLPRLVGYAKALEIVTLGKPVKAEEAAELGLATDVFAADEWEENVQAFASQFTQMATKAYSLVKRYMMDSMNLPFEDVLEQEAEAQRVAGLSADHQEGVQAFKEKRKPVYQGK